LQYIYYNHALNFAAHSPVIEDNIMQTNGRELLENRDLMIKLHLVELYQ